MNAPTPGRLGAVGPVLSVLSLLFALVLFAGLCLLTTVQRDSFLKIFADFDAELPVVTQLVIVLTGPAFALGVVAVGVLLVIKEVYLASVGVKITMNLAAAAAAGGLATAYLCAMFLPLVSLIEKLT